MPPSKKTNDVQETPPKGAIAEMIHFALNNKKWWLTPIVVLLVIIIALIVLGGSGVSPFIYSLF